MAYNVNEACSIRFVSGFASGLEGAGMLRGSISTSLSDDGQLTVAKSFLGSLRDVRLENFDGPSAYGMAILGVSNWPETQPVAVELLRTPTNLYRGSFKHIPVPDDLLIALGGGQLIVPEAAPLRIESFPPEIRITGGETRLEAEATMTASAEVTTAASISRQVIMINANVRAQAVDSIHAAIEALHHIEGPGWERLTADVLIPQLNSAIALLSLRDDAIEMQAQAELERVQGFLGRLADLARKAGMWGLEVAATGAAKVLAEMGFGWGADQL